MPVERGNQPDLNCPWLAWDNRRYRNGEDIDVGYNGYAKLKLDGSCICRGICQPRHGEDSASFTENWQVDLKSGALRGPNLRKLLNDPDIYIRQA